MIGFERKDRSTFKYWFAHWCAFQMTALNLHIWKPRYLLHDIEKPWLMLLWKDYSRVQEWHRTHNNHHVEYGRIHGFDKMDIDAMIIDNECSRFTKIDAQMTAIEFIDKSMSPLDEYSDEWEYFITCLNRAWKLGLEKYTKICLNYVIQ